MAGESVGTQAPNRPPYRIHDETVHRVQVADPLDGLVGGRHPYDVGALECDEKLAGCDLAETRRDAAQSLGQAPKALFRGKPAIEPTVGGDPQGARGVHQQLADVIVGDRVGVVGIVPKRHQSTAVVALQPRRRSEPQEPQGILGDVEHPAVEPVVGTEKSKSVVGQSLCHGRSGNQDSEQQESWDDPVREGSHGGWPWN